MHRRWMACVLMVGLWACDDGTSAPGPDGGGADGADGAADGSGDGSPADSGPEADSGAAEDDAGADGSSADDVPLLERPARDPLACALRQPLLDYEPLTWGHTDGTLATDQASSVWCARVEAQGPDPYNPTDHAFVLSTLAADGELGTPTTIPVSDVQQVGHTAVAGLPNGGVVVVWAEGTSLRFATFAGSGAALVTPKTLVDPIATGSWPSVAVTAGGHIGIAWFEPSDYAGPSPLKFLAVDAQGARDDAATPVGQGIAGAAPALVAAPGGGFALLWISGGPYPEPLHVEFAALTEAGAIDVAAKQVSAPSAEGEVSASGFGGFGAALAAVEGGYVAAWTEGESGFETFEGAYQVVRLQKLTLNGSAARPPVTLRERTIDVDEVEPRFVQFGDALGLLWSRGTHIYICAGCVPDNALQFVLLDPEDLTPRSNVVEVPPNPAWGGGLLQNDLAVSGKDVLITTSITFHTWREPGFAALRCE